ncbi:MAG: Wadjet anti-phage system protein JetA family protein [Anaerovoracaceae bacterium]
MQLIEKSKQVSLLYETDAKDTLTLYFRNLAYAVEDEDFPGNEQESISSSKSESENAGSVLRYFRSCGWISEPELGRSGDNIAMVMPYCRKLMESIERIFNRDNSAALTNHIFSIYDILHSAFLEDHGRRIRPYSNILVPVADSIADLKNELLMLRDSIRSVMGMVIKLTETNALGQFLLRDAVMEQFFHDYFFIKKDGLVPGYIDEIEKMLRRLGKSEVYEGMIQEYQALYDVPPLQAREFVEKQLAEVRSFISYDYVKDMDDIDRKINRYYNLYSTRVLMVLSNNTNLQTQVDQLLLQLKAMDSESQGRVLEELSQCFQLASFRYVGRRSIDRRKKKNPDKRGAAVSVSLLTEEERERLTRELLHEQPDRYGVKQAAAFFDRIMEGKASVVPGPETVKTREDAMMFAAGMIYSGSGEFPFEVEFMEGTIHTPAAEISNIRIKRKINE